MSKIRNCVLYFFLIMLAAAIVLTAVYRTSLIIYLMPKAVLTEAIPLAAEDLKLRFENHPVQLLYNGLDPDSKQSITLDLKTTNALLGDIYYDMHLMTQPHQLWGEGTIKSDNKALDFSIYMDTDYMAVSSEDLLNSSYYGITYKTFQEDIRSIPLLSWMLGDAIISEWDMSVKELQSKMQQNHKLPDMPELSADKVKMLALALSAAPADVEKTAIPVQNQTLDCHRITYHVSGAQLPDFLLQMIPAEEAEAASLTAVFYLHERVLVLADISFITEEKEYHFQIEMGVAGERDPIAVTFSENAGSSSEHSKISLISNRDGNIYRDIWQIQRDNLSISRITYEWNNASGDMYLTVDDSETISLKLKEVDNGFSLEANDFTNLYTLLSKQAIDYPPVNGEITVQPGASFTAPPYKNLDLWSMDDFLILLEGFGGLLGLF